MRTRSDEQCESAHRRRRQREKRFGTHMTRQLSGPRKLKKAKEGISKFNGLNKGF